MCSKDLLSIVGTVLLICSCSKAGSPRAEVPVHSHSTYQLRPSGAPICGKLDDKHIHIPPGWDTFTPPALGQSYVDPVFGCSVKRLTDSSRDETAWDGKHVAFMNYYSTITPMN